MRRIVYDALPKFVEFQQRLVSIKDDHHERIIATTKFAKDLSFILKCASEDSFLAFQESALWEFICLFVLETKGSMDSIPDIPGWLYTNISTVLGKPGASVYSSTFLQLLESTTHPEKFSEYWNVVHRLVSLGWISEALDLLGLHSAWSEGMDFESDVQADAHMHVIVEALEAVTMLLRRFPAITGRGPSKNFSTREFETTSEFLNFHRSWQDQCRSLLNKDELWSQCLQSSSETCNELKKLLEILSGHKESLVATTWVELLVGNLIHVRPGVQHFAELRQMMHESCSEKEPVEEFLVILAAITDALCDFDVQTVVRACSEWASPWLMAHLPYLLSLHPSSASILKALPHLGTTQSEWFLLEFASALASSVSTWGLALQYLSWCNVYGYEGSDAFLQCLPLDAGDDRIILRATAFCAQNNMNALQQQLLVRQGTMCWQAGLKLAALSWYTRTLDWNRCDTILRDIIDWCTQSSDGFRAVRTLFGESLDDVPYGSTQCILLKALTNLLGTEQSSVDLSVVMEYLRQLPLEARRNAVPFLCDALPKLSIRFMTESDAADLYHWLEDEQTKKKISSKKRSVALLLTVRLLSKLSFPAKENV